jgi:DNA-binding response OmpR family regulator
MPEVLVVDDDDTVASVVVTYLERAGHQTQRVSDGQAALDAVANRPPDLVVLDLMLPQVDGLEVCRRIRKTHADLPIIMLTALGEAEDRIAGLEVGADDYVTKPFSPRELVARIRAMLRRPRDTAAPHTAAVGTEAQPRVLAGLSIDIDRREVLLDGEPVTLTRTEFDVLAELSSRPGVVFSRRQLLEAVWSDTWFGDEHLVDVHVGNLRRKLGDTPGDARHVITVRGVGYRMGSGR